MNYGLYISAQGMKSQLARQDVISNNLANSNTVGFKRDLAAVRARANAVFEDPRMRAFRSPVFQDQGGGVTFQGAGIDLSQGSIDTTTSPTDVALQGKGFFTVGGPDAEERGGKLLTRNGQFILNPTGGLVTADGGRPVLDESGQPITLNPKIPITIDENGNIRQADGGGVKLGIVDVADARKLIKLGHNVLAASDPAAMTAAEAGTQVLQYRREISAVDPMAEMVAMMEGQRSFEANARMITYQDQTMSQLNTVGRVA